MGPSPREGQPRRETNRRRPQAGCTTTIQAPDNHQQQQKPTFGSPRWRLQGGSVVEGTTPSSGPASRYLGFHLETTKQRTVGAGAPQRHLQQGNGVQGRRCRRQRQSRCRVHTRRKSTSHRTKAVDHHHYRRSPPHLVGTNIGQESIEGIRSSRAAGRSATTVPRRAPCWRRERSAARGLEPPWFWAAALHHAPTGPCPPPRDSRRQDLSARIINERRGRRHCCCSTAGAASLQGPGRAQPGADPRGPLA